MRRKERILSYIKSTGYVPLKKEELMSVLCVPEEAQEEFSSLLEQLVCEGSVIKTKRNRYEAGRGQEKVTGVISCSGYGFFAFLTPEDGTDDIYINGNYLKDALNGDRVLAVIDSCDKVSGKREAHVLKILEHGNKALSGVVKKKKDQFFEIRPDSPKIYSNILVPREYMMGAEAGERVIAEITAYSPDLCGIVKARLGDADNLESTISAVLFGENIKQEFDEATINEAENTPSSVSDEDIQGRADLRDMLTFTIDGDDAKDFDDAVSLEISDGIYHLGVHIADVTHYVKKGSSLDGEAYTRGTSVYLPGRVIPMLPEKLSNGICSLNPNEDRLTLSIFMDITGQGKVISHKLVPSVIHSRERMTYKNVTELLENPESELLKKYKYLMPTLKAMQELSGILRKRRAERGGIDFDFPETKIITNDAGIPTDILPAERGLSQNIIEDFMLCANETVAEYAFWAELSFIYRVHQPPSSENMRDLQRFVSAFGLGIKEKFSDDEPIHPKALQSLLKSAEGMEEKDMISNYLLRSLMKAEYKGENLGHFGLGAKYYCHFTSPIRRYPDLAIHRILKDFLKKGDTSEYTDFVHTASKHSSDRERSAEAAERDVSNLLKAYYMSEYVGYIYDAKISQVTEFGMFARLENTVEGLIRLETVKDDFYIFDSEKRCLFGKHTGRIFKAGDNIEIAVARCDLMTRQIDFILAENADMSDIDKLQKRAFKKKRCLEKKIKGSRHTRRKRQKR